ncbi:hypothetical protein [Priestia megaterium]|uniref:hypothetical protein n=1 Tax=Priestia megaterium TaxID=1404 RepID=UPI00245290B5|nr:hypothetical protein [Priestia megaterium]MDH3183542.1 hypothetical protein [Priestia megaterium]MDH3183582.1 hypothetical protein [Priestia megaterium]
MKKEDNKLVYRHQTAIERSAVEQYIQKLTNDGNTVEELKRGIKIEVEDNGEKQLFTAVLDGYLKVSNKKVGVEVYSTKNEKFNESVAKKINTDVLKLITLINLEIIDEGVIVVPDKLIEPFKKSRKFAKLSFIVNGIKIYGYKAEGQQEVDEIVYHTKLSMQRGEEFAPEDYANKHTESVFEFLDSLYMEEESEEK